MKNNKGIFVICFIIIIALSCVLCNVYQLINNKKQSEIILNRAYKEISSSFNVNDNTLNNLEENNEAKSAIILDNDIIGVLLIPKLNIEAPVKDGTSQEVMKTSVGHFVESNYWKGNVSFASHNGGVNAHYFENINQLKENDCIEYLTKLGEKHYKVCKVFEIESNDWSEIYKTSNHNTKNTITLITCINGHPKKRLCVKGCEI